MATLRTIFVGALLLVALIVERWTIPAALVPGAELLDPRWTLAAPLVAIVVLVLLQRSRGVSVIEMAWVALLTLAAASAALHPPVRALWCAFLPYVVGVAALWTLRASGVRRDEILVAATGAAVLLGTSVLLDTRDAFPWRPHGAWPPSGLLVNKNSAAEYLALALPAALVVLKRRWWLRPLLLAPIIAIVLIRCRTAWIGSFAVGAVFVAHAVRSAPSRRALAKVAGVVAVTAAIVIGASQLRISQKWVHPDKLSNAVTLQHLFDLQTGNGRVRMWENRETVSHVAATPIVGIGPGAWGHTMRARALCPHSDYMRALSDSGLFGLLALVCLYGAMLAAALQRFRQRPEGLAFVIALATMGLADVPLFHPESVVLVAALSLPLLAPQSWSATARRAAPALP